LRLSTYAIGIPAAAVAAVLAVANRQDVLFSLDPFSREAPAIAIQIPLFVLLFLAIGIGILFGWLAGAVTRRGNRPR
jgi:ribose/xylose/arabinose/galactoside ABC-type transport system permease subunit